MGIKTLFKLITGIAHLEYLKDIQEERIQNLTKLLLREQDFAKINEELAAKKEEIAILKQAHLDEIRQVERSLECTIDQQYSEIQKLRTQLAAATDYEGKFYVFNPHKDKPRKVYENYAAALADAKAVSRISNGEKILVLKIVSGVQSFEKTEDYSLIPEEEIPF